MKQNIYDDESFNRAYSQLREQSTGLNDVLEIPAFRSLLPDLSGKVVLDLGCGFGECCQWYSFQGAKRVIGIDISSKMIERARREDADSKIQYTCVPIEDAEFSFGEFDLVVSSLMFHYVADYELLVRKIYHWLKPGGFLLFSQEHPVATAKRTPEGWCRNADGLKLHWVLDDYSEESLREQAWLGARVIKYHRTTETIINSLIDTGFSIRRILEPTPLHEAELLRPELKNERRRPPFLIVKAQKD